MFHWSGSDWLYVTLNKKTYYTLSSGKTKNTFAYLPGEPILFNMNAEDGRSVTGDQMPNSGTEPDRDRSGLRTDEMHEETEIKKNLRTVSEIVFV